MAVFFQVNQLAYITRQSPSPSSSSSVVTLGISTSGVTKSVSCAMSHDASLKTSPSSDSTASITLSAVAPSKAMSRATSPMCQCLEAAGMQSLSTMVAPWTSRGASSVSSSSAFRRRNLANSDSSFLRMPVISAWCSSSSSSWSVRKCAVFTGIAGVDW